MCRRWISTATHAPAIAHPMTHHLDSPVKAASSHPTAAPTAAAIIINRHINYAISPSRITRSAVSVVEGRWATMRGP